MKKLYIKQKVFSLGEKFTVLDEGGNVQYAVEGSFLRIPKTFTIKNSDDQVISEITKKTFSLLPKFFVEIDGEEEVTIAKELTLFKPRYTISAKAIDVQGDWWDMDFEVQKNDEKVAEINKRWLSWGDTYEVAVFNEKLEELIISLVIAIDCVKADEAAAASSASS